ncbi:MAG TPA: LamG-like jellyroll fold domain-containing protein, partial [Fimbriimonas sp.]|nr:LamG-like jellyroll fold domain-containing protein [Fimbriimonas sp.]
MPIPLLLVASIAGTRQAPQPVLWVKPSGVITVQGSPIQPEFTPGSKWVRMQNGFAIDIDGKRGGVRIPDLQALQLDGSITMAGWFFLRSYVNEGPGAQILFRGDDRIGLDPYYMAIHGDGRLYFAINSNDNRSASASGEIELGRWTRVVANYSTETKRINFWVNGEHVAATKTSLLPFKQLNTPDAPGVGI